MAVQDIIISIGGDTENLKKSLTSASKELDKFNKEAGKVATNIAGAMAAATAAVSALAVSSANAEKEWSNFSKIANDSVSNFKAAAFATNQVGISAEKLADISKDTREKLGEFISTGGGGFKDFFEQVAPLVNLTAKELQDLSGPDALIAVKKAMDDANVSIEQQSFYLESIASDTTALIPLLANEGAELRRLSGEYRNLNDHLALTPQETENMRELAESFNLLGSASTNAISHITGKLAPALTRAFDEMAKKISTAAEAIGFFIDSFDTDSVAFQQEKLKKNLEEIARIEGHLAVMGTDHTHAKKRMAQAEALKEENRLIYENIQATRKKQEVEAMEVSTSPVAAFVPVDTAAQDKIKEQQKRDMEALANKIDAIKKQYSTEQELLYEKLASEQEIIDEARANGQIDTDEWYLLQLQAKQGYEDGLTEIERQGSEARLKIAEAEAQARKQALGDMLSNLSALMGSENKKQFEIGKKAAIAQTAISTMEGAQKAFTGMVGAFPGPVGIALGVAAAGAAIAAGNVRLQAIRSQQFGGAANTSQNAAAGGVVSPPSGGGGGGEQGVSKSITVRGIDQNSLFTGGQLIDLINSAVENGYQLRVQQ